MISEILLLSIFFTGGLTLKLKLDEKPKNYIPIFLNFNTQEARWKGSNEFVDAKMLDDIISGKKREINTVRIKETIDILMGHIIYKSLDNSLLEIWIDNNWYIQVKYTNDNFDIVSFNKDFKLNKDETLAERSRLLLRRI